MDIIKKKQNNEKLLIHTSSFNQADISKDYSLYSSFSLVLCQLMCIWEPHFSTQLFILQILARSIGHWTVQTAFSFCHTLTVQCRTVARLILHPVRYSVNAEYMYTCLILSLMSTYYHNSETFIPVRGVLIQGP